MNVFAVCTIEFKEILLTRVRAANNQSLENKHFKDSNKYSFSIPL